MAVSIVSSRTIHVVPNHIYDTRRYFFANASVKCGLPVLGRFLQALFNARTHKVHSSAGSRLVQQFVDFGYRDLFLRFPQNAADRRQYCLRVGPGCLEILDLILRRIPPYPIHERVWYGLHSKRVFQDLLCELFDGIRGLTRLLCGTDLVSHFQLRTLAAHFLHFSISNFDGRYTEGTGNVFFNNSVFFLRGHCGVFVLLDGGGALCGFHGRSHGALLHEGFGFRLCRPAQKACLHGILHALDLLALGCSDFFVVLSLRLFLRLSSSLVQGFFCGFKSLLVFQ